MRAVLRIAELVPSPSFSDGNALYTAKRAVITAITETVEEVTVEASVTAERRRTVSFAVDAEGGLGDHHCSQHGDALCEDVVAAALKYNELIIEDRSPVTQLADVVGRTLTGPAADEPVPLRVAKEGGLEFVTRDIGTAAHLARLLEKLAHRERMLLLAVSPHSFIFGGMWVKKGDLPVDVHYRRDGGTVRFSLPASILFDPESGVVFDREQASVIALQAEQADVLRRLLQFRAPFGSEEELFTAVRELSGRVSAFFRLTGELDNAWDSIDAADTLFALDFDEGRIYLEVFFLVGGKRIQMRLSRKDSEHAYAADGRLLTFSAPFMKQVRQAIRDAGFRSAKNRWSVPLKELAALLADDSPLRAVGEIETIKKIARIEIAEEEITRTGIGIELHPDDGWFSFSVHLPETVTPLPPASLIDAIRQLKKGNEAPVVVDSAGDPVIIERSVGFLNRLNELFAYGSALPADRVNPVFLPHFLKRGGQKFLERFDGTAAARADYEEIIRSFSEGTLPELIDRPEFAILRPYQRDGVRWIALLRRMKLGGILADEMGLGKTIQSLAALIADPTPGPTLVVTPKTLVWSWDREIQKFFPELKRTVIDAMLPEERTRRWRATDNGIIITSYAILVNDLDRLKGKRFRTLIVDEAQHIKNQTTKRFRALQKVECDFRLALTGTPMENHLADLWSIFQFLMPGLLGRRQEVEKIERTGDTAEFEKLALITAPFILRREKKDLLPELPPVIIKEYPVEMTPKQKEIYLSYLLRGRAEFLELGGDMNKIEVLALLTKLRLAANHPMMVSDKVTDIEESGKIALITELIDEIRDAGGRVLIFSQFVKMLAIIEKALKKRGIAYFYMDGDTQDRRDPVERFNRGERDVFLLSLKVGGFGLNLTGADNVIIVDPWWNPAVEEQAWSRAHRIGQDRQVVVSKLFARETIEEKILDLQQSKKGLTGFFMKRTLAEPSKDFIKMLAELELKGPT